ncbi:mannonate dehydratase [Aggregatilinea lenta]|uniref:mannonate dehydratase n=1 Tax=Aggregatilinea lenta TaxID=913108 RepID=UPI000E5AFB98|nr:mannonate dehydratase [Aggregatilinea lenta]
MQLGLGLYRHMLTQDNYRFARQAGATAIVAHLCDYFAEGPRIPTTRDDGWGVAGTGLASWQPENLAALKASIEAEGLALAAVENLDPMLWYDVLLDGPRKAEQLETVKAIIRRFGEVGIPVLGYNFSLAGVWGHVEGPYARGGATSVSFLGADGPQETQIPRGMVWNMIYDAGAGPGTIGTVTQAQLWARLKDFLDAVLPVAEASGVRVALHPDDPPLPTLRDTARLVYQPSIYQRVLDLHPSPANALEFCIGSLAEMTEGDIYDVVDTYTRQDDVAYIHFRNIRGKVPRYHEVFVDEGDVDMIRVIRILLQNRFEGVIIPDHTPQMTCDAPWHAGMAFALGYIRAAIQACS